MNRSRVFNVLLVSILVLGTAGASGAQDCSDFGEVFDRVGFYASPAGVYALDVSGATGVVAADQTLTLLDLGDTEAPTPAGELVLSADVADVVVIGGHAFAALWSGRLISVDLEPAASMCAVDSLDLGGSLRRVVRYGDRVLALSATGQLTVVDATHPAELRLDSTIATQPSIHDLAILGHHALVAGDGGLSAVDLNDPLAPGPVTTWSTGVPGNIYPAASPMFNVISVDGDRAAVITHQWLHFEEDMGGSWPAIDSCLAMLDLSDPTSPQYLTWGSYGPSTNLLLSGDLIYATDWDGELAVLSADDLRKLHGTPTEFGTGRMAFAPPYIYAGLYWDGLAVYEAMAAPPALPLAVFAPTEGHRGGSGRYQLTAWGVYDPGNGCYDSAFTIWDLGDPAQPLARHQASSSCTESWGYDAVAVEGDLFAYSSTPLYGPTFLHICDMGVEPPVCQAFPSLWNTGMNVDLLDGVAWTVDYDDYLVATDVTDVSAPVTLSSTPVPQGIAHISAEGAYLRTSTPSHSLVPIDVTDPAAPVLGASHPLPGQYRCSAVDAGLVYVGTWTDLLHVVDITDIQAPDVLGEYDPAADIIGVHLQGDLALLLHPDAFRILSVADPSDPQPLSPLVGMPGPDPRLVWDGDVLYVNTGALEVWDLSDPADPRKIGEALAAGDGVYGGDGYVVSDGNVYLAQCALDVSVDEDPDAVPGAIRLLQAAPNPFNPRTRVTFTLARSGPVDLAVFDLRGRRLRTLATGTWSPGDHVATWDGLDGDGRSAPTGTYVMRLKAGPDTGSLKVMLIR